MRLFLILSRENTHEIYFNDLVKVGFLTPPFFLFAFLFASVYISSNYFHIGMNGTDTDAGGRNGPPQVFLLKQKQSVSVHLVHSGVFHIFPQLPSYHSSLQLQNTQ